ncbi:MAG: hypothetical protein ACYDGM_03650, partial [Vulcanimicrobiaceae bacterium]
MLLKHFARIYVAAVVVITLAVILFSSLNDDFYQATSPVWIPHHVIMRKILSIAAFSLGGYVIATAFSQRRPIARATICIALLSAAIEVLQHIDGSTETFALNAFDVLCGAIGGFIGGLVASRVPIW